MAENHEFTVKEIIKKNVTMNVKITGMKEQKMRFWIGAELIKLAAFIMRVGVEVKVENEPTAE